MPPTTANDRIVTFLKAFDLDAVPAATVRHAVYALLDTVGCILSGSLTPVGRNIRAWTARFPQSGGATVINGPRDVCPPMAAAANGFMANAQDADDGHRPARMHPSGIIVPAALAAAEITDVTGRDLIAAMVAGFEIGLRAGIVSNRGEVYYGSANGGTWGAAAAAGRILGLPPLQVLNALGICEMHAPVSQLMGWVQARRVPQIKEGMGWAAATGLTAAMMAREGVTGTLTLFDDRVESAGLDNLGHVFEIDRGFFKPYPSCRWAHQPLGGLERLLEVHGLDAGTVAAVEVHTFGKAACLDRPAPPTLEDAQYSIPFVLGARLADGVYGPHQLTEEKLTEPAILAAARRIQIVWDPELDSLYPDRMTCRVVVRTTDGRQFAQTVHTTRGDPATPMSRAELSAKFRDFAGCTLALPAAEALHDEIVNMEAVDSVQGFMERHFEQE